MGYNPILEWLFVSIVFKKTDYYLALSQGLLCVDADAQSKRDIKSNSTSNSVLELILLMPVLLFLYAKMINCWVL